MGLRALKDARREIQERFRVRYKLGEEVPGQVVKTGRPVVIPRVSQEPLFLDRTKTRRRDRSNPFQGHDET